MKYLRFERALECPAHLAVVEEATRDLEARGCFSQIDVMDRLKYSIDVRWDYIQKMLEQRHDTELVRLTQAFFKRHSKDEEHIIPGHFIAQNRKRTVGYAIASRENGHLVKHVLKNKQNAAIGLQQTVEKTRAIGMRVGIPDLSHPVLEPPAS